MAGNRNIPIFVDTVLTTLQTKLSTTDGLFPIEYTILALDEAQGLPGPTDQYVTLVPGAQVPDLPVIAGAAASTITPITGTFAVILWTRLSVDVEYRDDAYLTDRTLGAVGLQRKIIKSLELFDPTNAAGDYLFGEPCRMGSAGFNMKPKKIQPGWGGTAMALQVYYLADLVS